MSDSGHPHDAVANFVRLLLTKPEEIVIPGGISREVHWFLRFFAQIVGQGSSLEIPIDLFGEIITNVRAGKTGSDWYGLALFGTLMSDEGEGLRFKEFFETLISTKKTFTHSQGRKRGHSTRYGDHVALGAARGHMD